MHLLGLWILYTFGIYYVIALITSNRSILGSLVLGAVLALGIVLAFH